MKITLFNCAWTNRGDEAAFRSMVNELRAIYPSLSFTLVAHGKKMEQFPYDKSVVEIKYIRSITRKNYIDIPFLLLSRGRFAVSKNIKALIKTIKESDMVFHNPGGPSMGDLYKSMQFSSYYKFIITRLLKKPYLFYAPSMGPFNSKLQNVLRRYIYNGAELVTTREDISAKYYEKLGAKKEAIVTADSALQHKFDTVPYEKQFEEYTELKEFLNRYEKVVGITIATMRWHKVHHTDEIENRIKSSFTSYVDYLKDKGYGVVFIPQIFGNGEGNDYPLMQKYARENCFVIDDEHDCFFQQYVISKLYAVVGLRYHSNIFSAKMKTPFISVAYEQKMNGFVKLAGMDDYLINLPELTFELLKEKFELLEKNYDAVKKHLTEINPELTERSHKTTLLAKQVIDKYYKNVEYIIKNDKCFACGLCSKICPENAISIKPNKKSGFYEVELNNNACIKCGLCLSSCPADSDSKPANDTIGDYSDIILCHSTDKNVRKMATSGGVVNSVIRYLIESGTANSVLTVKENINAPFDSEIITLNKNNYRFLLDSPRDFASRYVSVPILSALPDKSERAAIVGTPCQIKALSKYDKGDSFFKIGIVCSAATSFKASELIKKSLAGRDYHIYYRGNGWPGYNTLTNGKNTIETTHAKSSFEKLYTSQLFKRRSCRFCPSHFAEESDLSFFDFWNAEEIKNEHTGNSVCVIRSEKGEAVFNGALNGGYIEGVKSLDESTALKTQGVALKYKCRRPYSNKYFSLIDLLGKSGLYRLIPLKWYKYLCRLLAKTVK